MGRPKIKDKRVCYCCGSDKTATNKKGWVNWIKNYDLDNNYLCQRCYCWLFIKRRWIVNKYNKTCFSCGVDKSYNEWFYNYDEDSNVICTGCYKRIFKPSRHHKRKMWFTPTKKTVVFKEDPHIGVCNWCRKVVPFDCPWTTIHHDEDKYDITNPLKNGIEVCPTCHALETNKKRKRDSAGRFM